jgi:hypothetical protein
MQISWKGVFLLSPLLAVRFSRAAVRRGLKFAIRFSQKSFNRVPDQL